VETRHTTLRSSKSECRLKLGAIPKTYQSTKDRLKNQNMWHVTCSWLTTRSSATDRSSCNQQAHRRRVCWSHQYTYDLLWRNVLNPKCRNYSRDPDHAHLLDCHWVITRLILHMANPYTKFEVSSISRTGIARGVTFQNGSYDSDHAPFQGWFFSLAEWDLLWSTYIPNLKSYKNLKSGAKCRNWGGSIFYRFRDIANHLSEVADFYLTHLPAFCAPVRGDPSRISRTSLAPEN